MNVQELKQEVIPAALAALGGTERSAESDSKSPIRSAEFSWHGETFRAIDQNLKKLDARTNEPTRFAKLALNGHEVLWIVREHLGQWYLVVDGKPVKRNYVTNDGQLVEGAEFE